MSYEQYRLKYLKYKQKYLDLKNNMTGGAQIFIKTLTGKTLTIDFNYDSDKVQDLKNYILEKEGIPVDQQRLMYYGKVLNDESPLNTIEPNISTTGMITMVRKVHKPNQIFIKTLTGKTLNLNCFY